MAVCSFEVVHARWAMLAALGALIPEILDLMGAVHFVEPVWWRVGYSKLKVSMISLLIIQHFIYQMMRNSSSLLLSLHPFNY